MSRKLTYEEVKNHIESFEGYKLLSKEYKNVSTKLKLKCPKNHIFWTTYNNFQQGRRCSECSNNKKLTYGQVKNYIESFKGYILLSKDYKNTHTKLKISCPEGHVFWIKYSHFYRGVRCSECIGNKKLTHGQVKKYIESVDGYKLLSEDYKNVSTKLEIQCPEGHIFWMNYDNFKQGERCSECVFNKKITNYEIINELRFCEDIRETEDKQIEVKCTYCGGWHIPKRKDLWYRIYYVRGNINSECRLYCSQQCKDECPIFNQKLYPKDNKPATSREVQPQLRQMVLARDNYTCQKCGYRKNELDVGLHCHHIFPLNESPITSADIDECITFCKDCHEWVHMNVAGCGYAEMKCSA